MFRNKLYESTGGTTDLPQTKSLFGILDLSIGKIKPKVELNKVSYFGEGITFCNGKVFQLTYKNRLCFAYDAFTFKKTNEYTLPTQEGWGITTDGTYLIMSDGTHNLTYINPIDFSVVKTLCVIENNTLVEQLNELEFINGFVYANIWLTNKIVKIDTTSGEIVGYLDLTSLAYDAKNIYPGAMEMNGIAFDSSKSSLYVTGKMWPKLYELSFNCR
jgi:glutamine cyclotransferase